jgi:acetylornithine/succinyldiaminopimelate/putrescine aminotransferase
MITEGKMQYLYDEKGRRYLDVSAAQQQKAEGTGWRSCAVLAVLLGLSDAQL